MKQKRYVRVIGIYEYCFGDHNNIILEVEKETPTKIVGHSIKKREKYTIPKHLFVIHELNESQKKPV